MPPPKFAADCEGTVTAGNSSSINDAASAVLLGAEGALDVAPLARITGRAVHGVDPDDFPIAPIEAANKALARAGRTWADVDLVELNEAFASQALACLKAGPSSTPRDSTCTGVRSRSATLWVPRAGASSAGLPMSWRAAVRASRSWPCASVSARAWPSFSSGSRRPAGAARPPAAPKAGTAGRRLAQRRAVRARRTLPTAYPLPRAHPLWRAATSEPCGWRRRDEWSRR